MTTSLPRKTLLSTATVTRHPKGFTAACENRIKFSKNVRIFSSSCTIFIPYSSGCQQVFHFFLVDADLSVRLKVEPYSFGVLLQEPVFKRKAFDKVGEVFVLTLSVARGANNDQIHESFSTALRLRYKVFSGSCVLLPFIVDQLAMAISASTVTEREPVVNGFLPARQR